MHGLDIRPVLLEDVAALYEMARLPSVAANLGLLPSLERAEVEAFVAEEEPGRHFLVAVVDGQVVGAATLQQHLRPRISHAGVVGLMVRPDRWRRGIGAALMDAVIQVADNWLNLARLEMPVLSENVAALQLCERHDFVREGLCRFACYGAGGWQDQWVMARLRGLSDTEVDAGSPSSPPERADPPPRLETLEIRPQRPEDLDALHAIARDPRVGRSTLQLPTQTLHALRQRREAPTKGIHRFVADAGGRIVGMIALKQHQNPRHAHAAELAMAVDPAFWDRGIGGALMEAALDLADNWLALKRIELDVFTDNPAGIHLYRKHGFVVEGTRRFHAYGDGRWAHSHFMARIRSTSDL